MRGVFGGGALGFLFFLSCVGTSIEGGGFGLGQAKVGAGGRVPEAGRDTPRPLAKSQADGPGSPQPSIGGDDLSLGADLLAHSDEGDQRLDGPIPLMAHQVADLLREMDPLRFHQLQTLLALDARIRNFAAKHGIFVPASDLRLATRRAWASVQRRFQRTGQRDFESFCERFFGMSSEGVRKKLRLAEARRLLRSYALRFRLRRTGSVTLDFVWTRNQRLLERFHQRIRSGASFEPLLQSLFKKDPKARGGHLPPLPLDAGHLALRLIRKKKGLGIIAPQPLRGAGGEPGFAWVRVLSRSPRDPRSFEKMWPSIQRDLARNPVGAGELELFLQDRYDGDRDG